LKHRTCKHEDIIPIYIRLTVNGTREEWSTGRRCRPEDWDNKLKRVKGNKEEARSINHWLDLLSARAYACKQEIYASGKQLHAVQIRKLMQGEELDPPKMLSQVWTYHTNQIAGLVGKSYTPGTLQKYTSVFRILKKYLMLRTLADDIRLDQIDYRFIRDFEYYLKTDYGVKINTAIHMVKKLRTIMKVAQEIGWINRDPFVAYRAKKEEVFREYLTSLELHELATKKLSGKRLRRVRDLFLFSCYTGLSYADTVKLRSADIIKGGMEHSGGLHGFENIGLLESVLGHITNEWYYTEIEDKATYLCYSVIKKHSFNDGNKRSAIVLTSYFLEINGLNYCTNRFILEMENFAVYVAANFISQELLHAIITSIIYEDDYSESLKLEIATALSNQFPNDYDSSIDVTDSF
jgi:death-on-curing family protein